MMRYLGLVIANWEENIVLPITSHYPETHTTNIRLLLWTVD
ncbi:hypothetical protein [Anabaena sp. UHCC 0399]|nr:hypothetical protein [Anabaena sp. UHCC 0399]MEA5568826.1 hypothetical protein [Anabaena sp. UHCC 0399]